MNIDELNTFMIQIGSGEKLYANDKKMISKELPRLIEKIGNRDVPAKISLPTGEKIGSASRITALRCHSLLLARKAFGKNYRKENIVYE